MLPFFGTLSLHCKVILLKGVVYTNKITLGNFTQTLMLSSLGTQKKCLYCKIIFSKVLYRETR